MLLIMTADGYGVLQLYLGQISSGLCPASVTRGGGTPRSLDVLSQANLAWLFFLSGMGGWGLALFFPLEYPPGKRICLSALAFKVFSEMTFFKAPELS